MAQMNYGYKSSPGVAGGLYDISPHAVDSRRTEGKVLFGMGLVKGSIAGDKATVPESTSVESDFEGLILNSGTTELDMGGKLEVPEGYSASILYWGRAWGRISKDAEPNYGDALFLIKNGDEAGFFTTENAVEDKIKVPGRFLKPKTDNIAPVEIYNTKL